MNSQNKHGHGLPFELIKWSLLVYSGYRSFDILQQTAGTFNMLLVLMGLMALDGGVLVWSHLYEKKAEGNQATLAALLTVVDFVGVALATLADMLLHNTAMAAQYSGFINTVAVFVVGAIIVANIGGIIMYPMLSPVAERTRKEKELEADYNIKARAAEHDLKLAQLELANSRTQSEARRLRLQATDTLFMPPTPQALPDPQMAKNSSGPLADIPTDDEMKRVMEWMKANGGTNPK